ncbi:MAG TPA: hypothetical protein VF251_09910, partial [Pyrinomonadaceae bacterium]
MKKRYWIAGGATAAAGLAVAAKLLTRPLDVDWNKNRDSIFHAEHSRFLDVEGIRVHVQEAGEVTNPPLL